MEPDFDIVFVCPRKFVHNRIMCNCSAFASSFLPPQNKNASAVLLVETGESSKVRKVLHLSLNETPTPHKRILYLEFIERVLNGLRQKKILPFIAHHILWNDPTYRMLQQKLEEWEEQNLSPAVEIVYELLALIDATRKEFEKGDHRASSLPTRGVVLYLKFLQNYPTATLDKDHNKMLTLVCKTLDALLAVAPKQSREEHPFAEEMGKEAAATAKVAPPPQPSFPRSTFPSQGGLFAFVATSPQRATAKRQNEQQEVHRLFARDARKYESRSEGGIGSSYSRQPTGVRQSQPREGDRHPHYASQEQQKWEDAISGVDTSSISPILLKYLREADDATRHLRSMETSTEREQEIWERRVRQNNLAMQAMFPVLDSFCSLQAYTDPAYTFNETHLNDNDNCHHCDLNLKILYPKSRCVGSVLLCCIVCYLFLREKGVLVDGCSGRLYPLNDRSPAANKDICRLYEECQRLFANGSRIGKACHSSNRFYNVEIVKELCHFARWMA